MNIEVTNSSTSAVNAFQEFSGPAAGGTIVGARNGANKVYTLTNAPNPAASLALFISANPLVQNSDYTLAGAVITLAAGTAAPNVAETILAIYDY